MPSVSPSTWMSEVIARHPQNQHLHNNLHVMKGMYNLLLKSNLKLASPGPDWILACWYVSILNLHNSIGIVFTCHGRALHNSSWLSFQHNTQLIHRGVHTVQGRAYILCLALVTLVHWCGPGARCIGLLVLLASSGSLWW